MLIPKSNAIHHAMRLTGISNVGGNAHPGFLQALVARLVGERFHADPYWSLPRPQKGPHEWHRKMLEGGMIGGFPLSRGLSKRACFTVNHLNARDSMENGGEF